MSFESAQKASSVLGCEGEELHTAVFKHHLRQLLQRATTGGSRERGAAEAEEGEMPGFAFASFVLSAPKLDWILHWFFSSRLHAEGSDVSTLQVPG